MTVYLDVGFSFARWFPLWPHASHGDGNRADLAFFYRDPRSQAPASAPMGLLGYGVYQGPAYGEVDQPARCTRADYWRCGLIGRLVPYDHNVSLDEMRTRELIELLARDPSVWRIFLEPHLRTRLGLTQRKVGYHGCRAVRHDDHVHIDVTNVHSADDFR